MIPDLKPGVLGGAIRAARIERGLSQEELAEMVEITPTHLKHIESEHRKPSLEVLYKLTVALRLSVDDIFLPGNEGTDQYRRAAFLLRRCDENQLKLVTAIMETLLDNMEWEQR